MAERWQWHGSYLKRWDPDWVAEATEPTCSDLCLTVLDGGMLVHTPRGAQRARTGDWLYRDDDGGVWIVPTPFLDAAMTAPASHPHPEQITDMSVKGRSRE